MGSFSKNKAIVLQELLKLTCTALRAAKTTTSGIRILMISKLPMIKGLKTVMKEEMKDGSKVLMLAMLPVPKKAASMDEYILMNTF